MAINRVVYQETQEVFFQDILLNKVAAKISEGYHSFSNTTAKRTEYRSWENSPTAVRNLLELSGIKDAYVTFEFQVPYSQKRIDCMLYGKDKDSRGYVVHIELKQWDKVAATNIEGNFVETHTGKAGNR